MLVFYRRKSICNILVVAFHLILTSEGSDSHCRSEETLLRLRNLDVNQLAGLYAPSSTTSRGIVTMRPPPTFLTLAKTKNITTSNHFL